MDEVANAIGTDSRIGLSFKSWIWWFLFSKGHLKFGLFMPLF
jgi:hypothetical protein